MRIALDTNVLYVTKAGLTRYTRGLLSGFQQISGNDNTFKTFAWETENFDYAQPTRSLKTAWRELVWAKFIGPRLIRKWNPDVFHSPAGWLIKPPTGIPHVVTLADLALIRHPERYRPWLRHMGRRRLDNIRQANRIICISEFTANEAMNLLDLSARSIEVIHCGCDFHKDAPRFDAIKPSRDFPTEYLLFVGSLEPGKNLTLLHEMYRLANHNGLALPPLVIVGARWQGVAHEGPPPPDWHYFGHIPDPELVWLYRHARALLFPSKYEGFGFPIAEAMALDCPVICSRVASLPEVGGDAALYAGLNASDYLKAVERICKDSSLREDLISRGRNQAKKFSWRECAEKTAIVYESISSHS